MSSDDKHLQRKARRAPKLADDDFESMLAQLTNSASIQSARKLETRVVKRRTNAAKNFEQLVNAPNVQIIDVNTRKQAKLADENIINKQQRNITAAASKSTQGLCNNNSLPSTSKVQVSHQQSGDTLSSVESDYDLLVYLAANDVDETDTELVDTERSADYQDGCLRNSICGESLSKQTTIDGSFQDLQATDDATPTNASKQQSAFFSQPNKCKPEMQIDELDALLAEMSESLAEYSPNNKLATRYTFQPTKMRAAQQQQQQQQKQQQQQTKAENYNDENAARILEQLLTDDTPTLSNSRKAASPSPDCKQRKLSSASSNTTTTLRAPLKPPTTVHLKAEQPSPISSSSEHNDKDNDDVDGNKSRVVKKAFKSRRATTKAPPPPPPPPAVDYLETRSNVSTRSEKVKRRTLSSMRNKLSELVSGSNNAQQAQTLPQDAKIELQANNNKQQQRQSRSRQRGVAASALSEVKRKLSRSRSRLNRLFESVASSFAPSSNTAKSTPSRAQASLSSQLSLDDSLAGFEKVSEVDSQVNNKLQKSIPRNAQREVQRSNNNNSNNNKRHSMHMQKLNKDDSTDVDSMIVSRNVPSKRKSMRLKRRALSNLNSSSNSAVVKRDATATIPTSSTSSSSSSLSLSLLNNNNLLAVNNENKNTCCNDINVASRRLPPAAVVGEIRKRPATATNNFESDENDALLGFSANEAATRNKMFRSQSMRELKLQQQQRQQQLQLQQLQRQKGRTLTTFKPQYDAPQAQETKARVVAPPLRPPPPITPPKKPMRRAAAAARQEQLASTSGSNGDIEAALPVRRADELYEWRPTLTPKSDDDDDFVNKDNDRGNVRGLSSIRNTSFGKSNQALIATVKDDDARKLGIPAQRSQSQASERQAEDATTSLRESTPTIANARTCCLPPADGGNISKGGSGSSKFSATATANANANAAVELQTALHNKKSSDNNNNNSIDIDANICNFANESSKQQDVDRCKRASSSNKEQQQANRISVYENVNLPLRKLQEQLRQQQQQQQQQDLEASMQIASNNSNDGSNSKSAINNAHLADQRTKADELARRQLAWSAIAALHRGELLPVETKVPNDEPQQHHHHQQQQQQMQDAQTECQVESTTACIVYDNPNDELMVTRVSVSDTGNEELLNDTPPISVTNDNSSEDTDSSFNAARENRMRIVNKFEDLSPTTTTTNKQLAKPVLDKNLQASVRQRPAKNSLVMRFARTFEAGEAPIPRDKEDSSVVSKPELVELNSKRRVSEISQQLSADCDEQTSATKVIAPTTISNSLLVKSNNNNDDDDDDYDDNEENIDNAESVAESLVTSAATTTTTTTTNAYLTAASEFPTRAKNADRSRDNVNNNNNNSSNDDDDTLNALRDTSSDDLRDEEFYSTTALAQSADNINNNNEQEDKLSYKSSNLNLNINNENKQNFNDDDDDYNNYYSKLKQDNIINKDQLVVGDSSARLPLATTSDKQQQQFIEHSVSMDSTASASTQTQTPITVIERTTKPPTTTQAATSSNRRLGAKKCLDKFYNILSDVANLNISPTNLSALKSHSNANLNNENKKNTQQKLLPLATRDDKDLFSALKKCSKFANELERILELRAAARSSSATSESNKLAQLNSNDQNNNSNTTSNSLIDLLEYKDNNQNENKNGNENQDNDNEDDDDDDDEDTNVELGTFIGQENDDDDDDLSTPNDDDDDDDFFDDEEQTSVATSASIWTTADKASLSSTDADDTLASVSATPSDVVERRNVARLYKVVNEICTSEQNFVAGLQLMSDFDELVGKYCANNNDSNAAQLTAVSSSLAQTAAAAASSSASMSSSSLTDDASYAQRLRLLLRHLPYLRALNEQLLDELKSARNAWPKTQKIAHVLVKIGPFLRHYSSYIREYQDFQATLIELRKKPNLQINESIRLFELKPECGKLLIQDHALKPVQRIPQYRLLLQQYLRYLKPSDNDYEDTVQALEVMSRVAEHADCAMSEGVSTAKLLALQSKVVAKQRDIVQPGRRFIRDGELIKVCRKRKDARFFVLLSDALLHLTKIQSSDIMYLKHEIPLEYCVVTKPDDSEHLVAYNGNNNGNNNGNDREKEDAEERGKEVKQIQGPIVVGEQLLASSEREFNIYGQCKSFTLIARDKAERDAWVHALRTAIDEHRARIRTFAAAAANNSHNLQQQYLPAASSQQLLLGQTAPVWVQDSRVTMCQLCTGSFTAFTRRHHCRACGRVVCCACSASKAPLVYKKCRVDRVCDECFEILKSDIHRYYLPPALSSVAANNELDARKLDEQFYSIIKSQFVNADFALLAADKKKREKRFAKRQAINKDDLIYACDTQQHQQQQDNLVSLTQSSTHLIKPSNNSASATISQSSRLQPTNLNAKRSSNCINATISGYLQQKRANKQVGSRWKRKWFVLRANELLAYRAIDDVAPQLSLPLSGLIVEQKLTDLDDNNKSLQIRLSSGKQSASTREIVHVLKADSQSDAERWRHALQEACSALNTSNVT